MQRKVISCILEYRGDIEKDMNDTELKNNSLTLFRYIAALQVILGHAEALLEIAFPEWIMRLMGLFQGVPLFFGISGFLVWQSLERNNSFKIYAKKRFIRIYPQLWMGVVFSVMTIIIFYNKKTDWMMLLLFLFTQASFLQFWTPDFLRDYGSGTPNGSLWTICIFVQFYIAVYFFYKLFKEKRMIFWFLAIGVSLLFDVTFPAWGG